MEISVDSKSKSPDSVIIEDNDDVSEIVLGDESSSDDQSSYGNTCDERLKKVFNEWRTQDFGELLLVKDYLFQDPLIDTLRPHEAFVYTLGLNLALESACNTYKYLVNKGKKVEIPQATNSPASKPIDDATNQKENIDADAMATEKTKQNQLVRVVAEPVAKSAKSSEKMFHLNIGIRNECDFFKNLDDNLAKIKLLNRAFAQVQVKQCRMCSFRSESNYIIDMHLTRPHNINFSSKSHKYNERTYMCSFCPEPHNMVNKEDYGKHIFTVHKRFYHHERPLNSYMCHLCDYECTKKNRLVKHYVQCNDNLQFKEAYLKKLQEPSLSDFLDYEFMFPSREAIEKTKWVVCRLVVSAQISV
jgi:hypothetical protein